jgi:hypothetical protein
MVAIGNLSGGRTWKIKDQNAECAGGPPASGFFAIALGGSRAVWSTWAAADFYYTSLETAVVGSRAKTAVGETGGFDTCSGGDLVQALAADEQIAAYSYVNVNGDSDNCTWSSVSGGVYSVASNRKIPGIPPAYALAVGDGFIAAIPVDPNPADNRMDLPGWAEPVYVYNARTRSTQTVAMTGIARGVAVSGSVLAVVVKLPGRKVIERFQTRNGALLGSSPVPSTFDPSALSVSGKRIVYSTRREIWLLDGVSGKRTLITTTAAPPIGLNIEGKRVYWGENRGSRVYHGAKCRRVCSSRGAILALTLP